MSATPARPGEYLQPAYEAASPLAGAYGMGQSIGAMGNEAADRNLAGVLREGVPLAAIMMSPAARMRAPAAARAKAMGYADDAFYRGESGGQSPRQYDGGAFFSRDAETAAGFAKRGGAEAPRDFRLDLRNTFKDYEPVKASDFARIVEAVARDNPKFAHEMVTAITEDPSKGVAWMRGFANARPGDTVAESGAHVRQMVDTATNGGAKSVFKRAGYDALDYGRDVEKLTGDGIRLANAAFDPAKASSRDITAGVAGAAAAPAALGFARPDERY